MERQGLIEPWRSILDLNSEYSQVELEESSRPMPAFITPPRLYQFKVMLFTLKNAPATFMHLMDEVLYGYTGDFYHVCLDDILTKNKNQQEHFEHLSWILERLMIHGVICQLKKCHFLSL